VMLVLVLVLVRAGPVAYLGALAFGLHLGWQTWRIDRRDGALALRLFRSNRDAGLILFGMLGLDALVRAL
jgi:4-hydroxybenzoate polyprenyltransferase